MCFQFLFISKKINTYNIIMPSKIRKSISAYKSKSVSHRGGARRLSKKISKKKIIVKRRRKSTKYLKKGGNNPETIINKFKFDKVKGLFGLKSCKKSITDLNGFIRKVYEDRVKSKYDLPSNTKFGYSFKEIPTNELNKKATLCEATQTFVLPN